jgi:hypothetical protein
MSREDSSSQEPPKPDRPCLCRGSAESASGAAELRTLGRHAIFMGQFVPVDRGIESVVRQPANLTCMYSVAIVEKAHGRSLDPRDVQALDAHLPVRDRAGWPNAQRLSAIICVRHPEEGAVLACALREAPSRAAPGMLIGRIHRVGGAADGNAVVRAIEAAASHARSRRRLLRLHVELFMPDSDSRHAAGEACLRLGFVPVARPRCYESTILMDLTPPPEEIFASLTKTARQNVRAAGKQGLAVRRIEAAFAPRLNQLLSETFARTGGHVRRENWPAIVRFCNDHPDQARLIGLFDDRPGTTEPLLAFALALNHGAYCEYATAASTRLTDVRVSLAYAPAWDLIQWARQSGARWFDFGGVTAGRAGSGDPLGGISDFKRYFSKDTVEVGAEFVLEARPRLATVARSAARVREWLERFYRRAG